MTVKPRRPASSKPLCSVAAYAEIGRHRTPAMQTTAEFITWASYSFNPKSPIIKSLNVAREAISEFFWVFESYAFKDHLGVDFIPLFHTTKGEIFSGLDAKATALIRADTIERREIFYVNRGLGKKFRRFRRPVKPLEVRTLLAVTQSLCFIEALIFTTTMNAAIIDGGKERAQPMLKAISGVSRCINLLLYATVAAQSRDEEADRPA